MPLHHHAALSSKPELRARILAPRSVPHTSQRGGRAGAPPPSPLCALASAGGSEQGDSPGLGSPFCSVRLVHHFGNKQPRNKYSPCVLAGAVEMRAFARPPCSVLLNPRAPPHRLAFLFFFFFNLNLILLLCCKLPSNWRAAVASGLCCCFAAFPRPPNVRSGGTWRSLLRVCTLWVTLGSRLGEVIVGGHSLTDTGLLNPFSSTTGAVSVLDVQEQRPRPQSLLPAAPRCSLVAAQPRPTALWLPQNGLGEEKRQIGANSPT